MNYHIVKVAPPIVRYCLKYFERFKNMQIKVSSYNILHCEDFLKEKIDYELFAETIDKFNSDVVGLNEVHGEGPCDEYDEQAEILGKKIGCGYYFSKATELDGNNPFGNAVLSRLPIKSCTTIPIPDPDPKTGDGYYETRALLKMTTNTNPELTFLITHFGLNEDEQFNAVKTVLDNIPEKNCILMGDFNVKPCNKILDPIREQMIDAAKDTEPFTFPSDKPNRKIDYIFVSNDISVKSFYTEDVVLSDHLAVSAELKIDDI